MQPNAVGWYLSRLADKPIRDGRGKAESIDKAGPTADDFDQVGVIERV